MSLLKLKMSKIMDYLSRANLDVDLIILKNSYAIKYMASEVYSPPPEEVPIHRIVIDVHSNSIEMYVSPLDYYRVREVYGDEGVYVYSVLSECIDIPDDMRCIPKDSIDRHIRDRTANYHYIAVDDTSICGDSICIDINDVIKRIRRMKSYEELELIRRAVSIAEKAIYEASSKIASGMSEIEIASIVEGKARELGAEGYAFSTIVAVGINTSKPHHIPSNKVYRGSEPVLIDFGVRISGYVSDITRVLIPSGIDKNYLELIELVEKARDRALSIVKSGTICSEVDEVARAFLRQRGFHKYFLHGLGHGIGVDVHEDPRLRRDSRDTLLKGDVITIEPGVYIYGRYGVRLEDDVHVDDNGGVVLSKGPKVVEV